MIIFIKIFNFPFFIIKILPFHHHNLSFYYFLFFRSFLSISLFKFMKGSIKYFLFMYLLFNFRFINVSVKFLCGELVDGLLEKHLKSANDFILFRELFIDLFGISNLDYSRLTIILQFSAAIRSISINVFSHSHSLLARSFQCFLIFKKLKFWFEFLNHFVKVDLLCIKLYLEFADQLLIFFAWKFKIFFQLLNLLSVCYTFFFNISLKLLYLFLEL